MPTEEGVLTGVTAGSDAGTLSGTINNYNGTQQDTFNNQQIEDADGNTINDPGDLPDGTVCDYDPVGGASDIVTCGVTVEVVGDVAENDTQRAITKLARKLGEDNGAGATQVIITKI